MDSSHYVVVGAGLAGAATAWRLAAGGHEVTVLERATPSNAEGSSHGSARIFRYAYSDPFYARLVVESRRGWDELERLAGERLITPTGALDHGAARSPAGLAEVLSGAGVEHELLGAAEAAERWPMFSFDGDVLWHPQAGVIDAESSVRAMLRLAADAGAVVRTGWELARVTRAGAGYHLESASAETVDAGRVVVCAGGWLPGLLGGLGLPDALLDRFPALEVRQEQAYHFPYRDATEGQWPTFIHAADDILVYGLPGGRDAGFRGQKIAEFNGGKVLPSAAAQDGVLDAANRRRVTDYVAANLPGLAPEPYAETTCLFTNTPSEDFVLDQHEGLTVVSACSGHGAKFAPLLGEIAAGLATRTRTTPEAFRIGAAHEGRRA